MTIRIARILAWLCMGLSASLVSAQTRTGTTSGAQPSSTGSTGSAGAANSTSAATGASGSSGGSSGSVNGGVPFSTGKQPEFNAGDGSIGDQIGQNIFAGQGNNAFVGRGNAGQNPGTSLTPQFGQFDNGGTQRNNGNTGNSTVKRARPQQRIAFTYPKANLARTRVEINHRFKRLATVSGVDTTISDEGVATLTGTVLDDDSRKLAEALTRLEPGVRSVVNELRLETTTPQ